MIVKYDLIKKTAKNKCEIKPNYGIFGLSLQSLRFVGALDYLKVNLLQFVL